VTKTKKISIKEETKTIKRQCPVSPVHVLNPRWLSNGTRKTKEKKICRTDGF